MKRIKVGSKFALVDNSDYEWLNQYTWGLTGSGYARTTFYGTRVKQIIILMHQFILGTKYQTEHKDNNRLNNQRTNLRFSTQQQNTWNSLKKTGYGNKYKGVSWEKRRGRWRAYIVKNNKQIYLGSFDSEIEAAKAYDLKAKELFGEFASLNLTA